MTFDDSPITLVDWCDLESYSAGNCNFRTSCSSGTLYYESGSESCSATCDYDDIFTASTIDDNPMRWYRCVDRAYWDFFEEQPSESEDISTTESSSSFTTGTVSQTASPASTGTTSVASPTTESTSLPNPTVENEKKSK